MDKDFKKNSTNFNRSFQSSLYRFSDAILTHNNSEGVIEAIKREIYELLQPKKIKNLDISKKSNLICTSENIIESEHRLLEKLDNRSIGVGLIKEEVDCFAIVIGESLFSFIVIVAKKRDTRMQLAPEIINWLTALAKYASIALENMFKEEAILKEMTNLRTINQPKWFTRLMYQWSEKERRRLASDIHDTFLQDLIVLKRRMEEIRTSDDLILSKDKLIDLEEEILDITYAIRETCNKLYPPFLAEMGLSKSVNELVKKFRLQSNIDLTVEYERSLNLPIKNKEIELTMYRIIQELLTNAIKHSKAKTVELNLNYKEGNFTITYKDNGVGIDKQTSDNFGLASMKGRVSSLGGRFQMETDKGLTVMIEIPDIKERVLVE